MKKILVVDDEPRFTRLVQANLESEGYEIIIGNDGKDAVEMTVDQKPDLVLLDVMMPEVDGFEACLRIRSFSNIPIIMLTAKGQEQDRVRGLDLGADDYIVKPFSANELLARVRSVLRRAEVTVQDAKESSIEVGDLVIDLAQAKVSVRGEHVSLSSTEYRLLLQFARNVGEIQTSQDLLAGVWGEEYEGEKEILWVSISRLRQKLEENPKKAKIIVTKSGEGYYMASD